MPRPKGRSINTAEMRVATSFMPRPSGRGEETNLGAPAMSILVDSNTRLVVQGITGREVEEGTAA
jgi:hypothetical protein